ncbi:MAG TPA: lipopolysaccharide biosynthesis protein [Vicinamibacterales bacterium]|jgi:O-antigen/teichoic acid export membrane protein|nr:lipopolysaccharide biosynthesis protein [Vicinamibacterales bacterium]
MANATPVPHQFDEPCLRPAASRLDSGVKPTFLLMSGRTVAFAATFFIPVVLARVFSQAEFGTYKQIFLVYATLYYIAQFGMAESLFYFLPSASRQAGRYIANSMLFLSVAGLGCLILLHAAGPRLNGWLSNPELSRYSTSIGLLLLLMMVSSVLEIDMIARRRYLAASVCYGASDLARAAFFVIPALVFRSIEALLFGALAFAVLRLAAALTFLARTFKDGLKPDGPVLKRQLRYALPFGAAIVLEICQTNLHQYAVSYYFDAATFAIYAVGCLQIPFVDFVVTSASNVMMVRMGEELHEGRTESAHAIWLETFRNLALVLVPLVGLLLVTARLLIVTLFTERYAAAAPIFMIWSLAILLAAFMTDGALRVYAETRFLLFLNAIRLVIVVSLIHWSIATFHLAGAVFVTLAATAVTKALGLARIARLMKVGPAALVPWRSGGGIVLAAAVAAVAARIVMLGLRWSPLPLLALAGGVYASVYIVLVWRCGLLTEREQLAIADQLRRWAGHLRPKVRPGYLATSATPAIPAAPVEEG